MMPAYPISLSSDGGLKISTDPDVDNILALIDTLFYERSMFPEYGVSLYPFDPASYSDLAVMILALQLAIELWHNLSDVMIDFDASQLESGINQVIIQLPNRSLEIAV